MSERAATIPAGGRLRIPLSQLKFWQGAFGHLGLSEAQRFLLLALLIGVFSGLLVVLFHITIDVISWTSLGALAGRFHLVRLLTPAAGAILAVLIVRKVFPRAKGSGVNQTKIAIYSSDGYVSSSTIVGKFLACAISIGSGNSLGPEDPSLQMGAGVASWLGRLFHLPRNSMRLIAPVGAGGRDCGCLQYADHRRAVCYGRGAGRLERDCGGIDRARGGIGGGYHAGVPRESATVSGA